MVTIKDIARELGVSPGTVSKGLNNAPDISEALKQKIVDTAISMGYKSSKLKLGSSGKKVCIFMENMDYESSGQFGFDIVTGFKQEALKEGFEVTLLPISPAFQGNEAYDSFMLKNGFSGSFCVGFALEDPWLKDFKKTTTPTVLFDNYISKNPKTCYVGTDNTEIMELIVSHLHHLGHKRLHEFPCYRTAYGLLL